MPQHKYTNALIEENSPYLLQHAHNPVNWYPWGAEALEKAKKENKMLIISIGYAACHWCHVMEHESYEDTQVASIMNEHFINIKVDREERPDIDDIYMSACQLSNGKSCGWPLNAFALPDGRPVWAGTYFPKKQWINILNQFIEYKKSDPERLESAANSILQGMIQMDAVVSSTGNPGITDATIKALHDGFMDQIDWKKGGRAGQPKFPLPNNYEFLLEYYHQFKDPKSLEAIELTLDNMAYGGIYDQLGGGFARYSVDKNWFAPHFEKMLYDNAQLVSLYSKAYQLTGKDLYCNTIIETLEFIERELSSPDGGFYSSLDADSEGEEGKFYVWTNEEIINAIPEKEDRKLLMDYYNCKPSGNWEHGNNILHRQESITDFAIRKDMDLTLLNQRLSLSKNQLMQVRNRRIRPGLDDKVLTSWNSLMMQGYIDAYKALDDTAYLEKALNNASFIMDKMMDKDYRLWRSYKNGNRKINGFLDDYATTIKAFLSLYEITFDTKWLQTAKALTDYTLLHFYDKHQQKIFYTSNLDPALVTRKTELTDNVIPGSVSMMAKNLYLLGHYFSEEKYTSMAKHLFENITPTLAKASHISYYSNWLSLGLHINHPPKEVVIMGDKAKTYGHQLMRTYRPDAIYIGATKENELALTFNRYVKGETMIYVCQNRTCKLPVSTPSEADNLLNQ